MKRRRRMEITIETDEVAVVHRVGAAPQVAPCSRCGKRVAILDVDGAARRARVSVRTIYRWVEEGRVHFQELPGSGLMVCSESLRGV
jgi:hypothetical protein